MALPGSDNFLKEYVSRHRRLVTPPAWSLPLLAALPATAILVQIWLQLDILWLVVSLACAVAVGFMSGPLLVWSASAACTVALVAFNDGKIAVADMAGWVCVVGACLGLIIRLRLQLSVAKSESAALAQLCELWGRTEGSCMKELSLDGALISMNHGGTRLMEVPDFTAICGRDWLGFWKEQWGPDARNAFYSARQGEAARFRGHCPTMSGASKWWDVWLMPVRGRRGVESVLSLSLDMTEAMRRNDAVAAAENELSAFLESMDEGFIQLDKEGNLICVNSRTEALLGQRSADLLGKNFWTVFPDLPGSDFRTSIADAAEGIPRRLETWLAPLNGWFRIAAYPTGGGASVFLSDITNEMANLENLRAIEARLRLSQQLGKFGDWHFDLGKRYIELSSQALQLLGLPPQSAHSQPEALSQRMHPDDRLAFLAAVLDIAEGAPTFSLRVRLQDELNPGQWKHFQWVGALLESKTHPQGLMVGSVQDVSEQTYREQKLIEAKVFKRNIIDALPLFMAVLDCRSRIVMVNQTWRNAVQPDSTLWADEGSDYLKVCREAAARGINGAKELQEGIEGLLENIGGAVQLDYEIDTGNGVRYYNVAVVPMQTATKQLLVIHEDVTERVQLAQTSRVQARRLKLAHDGSNDGLWEWSPMENQLYVSERFEQLIGGSLNGVTDFAGWLQSQVHPDDAAELTLAWRRYEEGMAFDVELRLAAHGDWRWFRARGKAEWEAGAVVRFAGSLMDISVHRQLLAQIQASERRFREMVEYLPHVFWEYDVQESRITYASPAFERISGIASESLYADHNAWARFILPDDLETARQYWKTALIDHQHTEAEYRAITPAGAHVWIRDRAFPFTNEAGKVVRMVGIAENITEARSYKERLFAADHYDSVNGLPNRLMFSERLEAQCSHVPHRNFMVMVITVERLTRVKQNLGEDAKDHIVREIKIRFENSLGNKGFLASLGSGEFALLLSREDEQTGWQELAGKMLLSMEEPFYWLNEALTLPARIGVACFPQDGETPELLLMHAHAAIANGSPDRSSFNLFNDDLFQAQLEGIKLETELTQALGNNEYALYYQPKFSLAEHRICGAEALIRWIHPVQGVIGPLRFIPMLEETEQIITVGKWCIETALAQLAKWQRKGLANDFVMAVNVSLKQLQPSLVEHVRHSLHRHSIKPELLELELTESIMHDANCVAVVKELRGLGVGIAVDDFGTGYSTLGSLKSFVPDTLKIDKAFLQDMVEDAADRAIIRGVVEMAHALDMVVVAEGVECPEQKDLLESLGCDQIQGYLLSRPIEAEHFEDQFLQ